jgi:FkbM family methyltransferase
MNDRPFRSTVKRLVPAPARKIVRRGITYFGRLRIWSSVAAEIEGATSRDESILRAARRRGPWTAFRDLDLWQDPHILEDAKIAVPGIGRFHVRAMTDDLYHVLPSREARVVSAIRANVTEGSTFVDAGANIGFFAILAAGIVGPTGRIYAIEMMPPTADRLRLNIAENGFSNIQVLEHALSAKSGEQVRATVPHHKFGRASIVNDTRGESHSSISVRTKTLDELLGESAGAIDLMKMDLEGAEAMALKGATRTLNRVRAIIFEQLPGESEAARLLEQSGFRLSTLDGNNRLALRN